MAAGELHGSITLRFVTGSSDTCRELHGSNKIYRKISCRE